MRLTETKSAQSGGERPTSPDLGTISSFTFHFSLAEPYFPQRSWIICLARGGWCQYYRHGYNKTTIIQQLQNCYHLWVCICEGQGATLENDAFFPYVFSIPMWQRASIKKEFLTRKKLKILVRFNANTHCPFCETGLTMEPDPDIWKMGSGEAREGKVSPNWPLGSNLWINGWISTGFLFLTQCPYWNVN